MRRALPLLLALVGLALPATASAHTISAAQAYGQANSYARNAAVWSHVAGNWDATCYRMTPWRYSCTIDIWAAGGTPTCNRWLDVVSPFVGYRLRVENLTRWECG